MKMKPAKDMVSLTENVKAERERQREENTMRYLEDVLMPAIEEKAKEGKRIVICSQPSRLELSPNTFITVLSSYGYNVSFTIHYWSVTW